MMKPPWSNNHYRSDWSKTTMWYHENRQPKCIRPNC